MPGTFSPSPQVSDPDMHHGTCVTHVPWCMPGSLTSGFLWNRRRGKTFPAFPAHAQPAILHIWLEGHCNGAQYSSCLIFLLSSLPVGCRTWWTWRYKYTLWVQVWVRTSSHSSIQFGCWRYEFIACRSEFILGNLKLYCVYFVDTDIAHVC